MKSIDVIRGDVGNPIIYMSPFTNADDPLLGLFFLHSHSQTIILTANLAGALKRVTRNLI